MRVREDFKPLRVLVYEQLLELISQGKLPAGSRLPSEPELSCLLKVSRNVLREALILLEQDGVILNQRGIGRTVIGPGKRPAAIGLVCTGDVADLFAAEGSPPTYRFVSAYDQEAGSVARAKLGLERGDRVLIVQSVMEIEGVPSVYLVDFIPHKVVPMALERMQSNGISSTYDLLTGAGVRLVRWDVSIGAARMSESDARYLAIPADSPSLLVEQVGFDPRGRASVYSRRYAAQQSPKIKLTVEKRQVP